MLPRLRSRFPGACVSLLLVLLVVPLANSPGVAAQLGESGSEIAAGIVTQYYAAIARRDFAAAYALLGPAPQQRQSEAAFANGFADTVAVDAASLGESRCCGASGVGVRVRITAWHTDGSIHQYDGSYSVERVGNDFRLMGAEIAEVAPDAGQAPLCRLADLQGTAGWQGATGALAGAVRLTNHESTPCTLFGMPLLTVLDATDAPLLSSGPAAATFGTPVIVPPRQPATVTFRWTNWCGAPPAGPLSIRVQWDQQELTAPVSGAETGAAPRCDDQATSSRLSASVFGAEARVRFIQTSPDTNALNVSVDGAPAASGVAFAVATDWIAVGAGSHTFAIAPGEAAASVTETTHTVQAGEAAEVATVGRYAGVKLALYPVDLGGLATNMARVRLINLSPDAGPVTGNIVSHVGLFPDLAYPQASAAVDVPPDELGFDLAQPSGPINPGFSFPPNYPPYLPAGTATDVFIVGLKAAGTLQVVAVRTSADA